MSNQKIWMEVEFFYLFCGFLDMANKTANMARKSSVIKVAVVGDLAGEPQTAVISNITISP